MAVSSMITIYLCFAAMINLTIVSLSPFVGVSYLHYGTISFGVLGYTGSKIQVGYSFPPTIFNAEILSHVTYLLIFYPIAACLCGLGVFFGLRDRHGLGNLLMGMSTLCAMLCTLFARTVTCFLYYGVNDGLRNRGGFEVKRGSIQCLSLCATIVLFISTCTALYGVVNNDDDDDADADDADDYYYYQQIQVNDDQDLLFLKLKDESGV